MILQNFIFYNHSLTNWTGLLESSSTLSSSSTVQLKFNRAWRLLPSLSAVGYQSSDESFFARTVIVLLCSIKRYIDIPNEMEYT